MYRLDTSIRQDDEGGRVLEFAILGLLHQSPMHGYEHAQTARGGARRLRSISYGSLYPAAQALSRSRARLPPTSPTGGRFLPADAPPLTGRRGKVVYTITAEGKERFHELVGQSGPEAYDDGGLFGVRLAFFRHTAADVRLRVLEGRRRTVERQREGLRASLSRTRERLDRYTLELQRPRPGIGRPRGPLARRAHRPRADRRASGVRSRRRTPGDPTAQAPPSS
jgi:DNA-binding PadR family transcriptional regulator